MTNEEFSNGFDILVSSYRRFRDFDHKDAADTIEFNEYEKSYFLTKAQEELVLSIYNGKNYMGDVFEGTEEARRYLADLVVHGEMTPDTNSDGKNIGGDKSYFFTLPDGTGEDPAVWFIVYEQVQLADDTKLEEGEKENGCMAGAVIEVYPTTHDEYHKIRKNPFRGANKRRALRLDLSEGIVEIKCKYRVAKYQIRYLRKPTPIVLETMPTGLEIDSVGTETPCNLHKALHQKILELAVKTALSTKTITQNNQ